MPALASGELQARHGGRAHARAGSQRGCGDRIGRVLLHETVPSVPRAGTCDATIRDASDSCNQASRLHAVSGLPLDAPRTAALRRAADHIERAWASFDARPRRPAGARRGARPRARRWAARGVHAGADGPRRRGAGARREPRAGAAALLRVRRLVRPRGGGARRRAGVGLRRQPRRRTPASPTWSSARRWTGSAGSWATRPPAARSPAAA